VHDLNDVCARDIVIDTNVLAHAHGGGGDATQQASSLAILVWLRATRSTAWVLDDQGKAAPNLSTSVLATEYFATLPPQAFGLTLLAELLASGRVRFSPRPARPVAQAINRLIPNNKSDRAVLGAAAGALDKVLVSNDEDDFSPHVRTEAQRRLGVLLLLSDEAAA
jgi:hypothetical protein